MVRHHNDLLLALQALADMVDDLRHLGERHLMADRRRLGERRKVGLGQFLDGALVGGRVIPGANFLGPLAQCGELLLGRANELSLALDDRLGLD